jgi:hypothetical protein
MISQSTAKQVTCLIGGYGVREREFTVPLLSRILKLKFCTREEHGAGKFSFAVLQCECRFPCRNCTSP